MARQLRVFQVLLAVGLVGAWSPAAGDPEGEASFHLMKIVEVFPGTTLEPSAQFVELQAYAAGQNFTNGHRLYFFNAAGVKVDSVTLTNVVNSASQMSILFATASAQTLFSISADFIQAVPTPRKNNNALGVLPPSTCGNSVLEGLEQCDDGNTTPNDGCNSLCDDEFCGDSVIQTGETCDDGNLTAGDGCDGLCQSEVSCLVTMTGDLNVNGTTTSSDVIYTVNHVFKASPPPCDVRTLVPAMWSCS